MASQFVKCSKCKGNMWPPGQMEHPHIDNTVLKKKYRARPVGWSKAANPRTNPPQAVRKTVVPRKRAYGPF